MLPIPNVNEKSRLVSEAIQEFMAKTGVKNCLIVMSYDEPVILNGDGGVTAQNPDKVHPFGMAIKCDGPNMHTAMLSFLAHSTIQKFPHIYSAHMEELSRILAAESPMISIKPKKPSES